MMISKFTKAAVCLAIVGAISVSAADAKRNKVVSQITVTDKFASSELTWRGRPDLGYTLRWKTIRENGEIHICGAVAYGDIGIRNESIEVLRRAYIIYQDKKIMRNLRFFNKVKSAKNLVGSKANCASTGIKAPKGGYRVRLGWGSGPVKG